MTEFEILQQILNKLTNLEQGQARLDTEITRISQSIATIEIDHGKLDTEITRISQSIATIETDHDKKLGLLLDAHALMLDKLEPMPIAVEALQDDVSVIKAVVTSHSKDITILKAIT